MTHHIERGLTNGRLYSYKYFCVTICLCRNWIAGICVKIGSRLTWLVHKILPLRWWFVFIGYASAFAVVGICLYFIVLFGAALGETLTTQWIISMVIGLLKSIFVIQPLKVYTSTTSVSVCVSLGPNLLL